MMPASRFATCPPAARALAWQSNTAAVNMGREAALNRIILRKKKTLAKSRSAHAIAHAIQEHQAMGEERTLRGSNFVGVQRQRLVDGCGDGETIQLLYGWMGHTETMMCMRYRRGAKSMRLGVKVIARGRRALCAAWRRWAAHKTAGLVGDELLDFDDAFDLALAMAPSFGKVELRKAYALADARHQRFAKRSLIAIHMPQHAVVAN